MISVLYVDDEEHLLDITKTFLEKTGEFHLETITSPREALKLLEQRSFDALVSDYEMPEMNGLEFLESVRNRWKNIPFIIFTGRGREEVVIRAFDLGADFYLQKGGPSHPQFAELAHKIKQAVQGRRSDLALRSSEEKFSKAFSLIPIAMAITDFPKGRFIDVNDVFLEHNDFSREDIIGRTASDLGLFVDPCFRDRIYASFEKGEKIRNIEMECVRKNGERQHQLFSADLFQMNDETFSLSFSLDITERKKSETELRTRDAILQAIAVSATRLLGARDLDRAISETLGSLGSAVGVDRVYVYTSSGPPDHPVGNLAYEWVAAGAEPWTGNPRHTCIPYREAGFDTIIRRLKNGEVVLFPADDTCAGTGRTPACGLYHAAIVPIQVRNADWGIIGFETGIKKEWLCGVLDALKTSAALIGSAIERNVVANALTESEEIYRSLFNTSPDGIAIADTKGKILFASPRTIELVRAGNESRMLGTGFLDWVAPEFRENCMANFEKLIGAGETCESVYRILRRDGTSFIAEISCSPLHDASGKTTAMISILRDISSRIKSDDALRLANTKLNLLSSITRHDILNKLTAMGGYLELLKEKNDPAQDTLYLKKIDEIMAVIVKLLAFTRDYQDMRMKDPEWQNVASVLSLVSSLLDLKEIAVDVRLDGLSVYADPLFQKVLYNLLDNAIRYGETLTTVTVSSRMDGNDCIITIEDDGVGISASMKEKIFDRGCGKNGGFGLFLVREILGITGMSIRETGIPGMGARFDIRVPAGGYRFAGNK